MGGGGTFRLVNICSTAIQQMLKLGFVESAHIEGINETMQDFKLTKLGYKSLTKMLDKLEADHDNQL